MAEPYINVVVKFSDGTRFSIPAKLIAFDRAKYYAEHDTKKTSGEEFDAVLNEELEYALGDESELLDWANNNMDWKDVANHAIPVTSEKKSANYNKEWTNADKSAVR